MAAVAGLVAVGIVSMLGKYSILVTVGGRAAGSVFCFQLPDF